MCYTYLFSHLPYTVDELNKDWRSVLIRMVLVTLTYPLHTQIQITLSSVRRPIFDRAVSFINICF